MSGDVTPGVTRSFTSADDIDFGSSAGIQQLLTVVRGTPMSRSDYNNLRDLIFSYKQQADAPHIKEEILSELYELGLLATAPTSVNTNNEEQETDSTVTETESSETEAVSSDVNPVPIKVIKEDPSPAQTVPAPTPAQQETVRTSDPVSRNGSVSDRAGHTRPKPSFGVSSNPTATGSEKAAPEPTSVPKPNPAKVPMAPVSAAMSTPPAPPKPKPVSAAPDAVAANSAVEGSVPDVSAENEESNNEIAQTIESQTIPASEVTPNTPEMDSDPISAPEPMATPEIVDEPEKPVSYSNPIERIKAIKHEVNTLVGNPINLIDTDNEVGREYMNALLDAMKKANAGVTTDINAAMDRLEKSFIAVKSITNNDNTSAQTETVEAPIETVEEEPENTPTETTTPELEEQVLPDTPESVTDESVSPTINTSEEEVSPLSSVASAPASSAPSMDSVVTPVETNSPSVETAVNSAGEEKKEQAAKQVPNVGLPKSKLFAVAESDSDDQNGDSSAPAPMPEESASVARAATPNHQSDPSPAAALEVKAVPTVETQAPARVPVESSKIEANKTPSGFSSVAEQKAKQTEHIEHVMEEAAAEKQKREAEISRMDPLMVPEITNGLNQLLSEWKLFKSSGIFGTGPSGAEHPLYKKLANLQMTAVVTGRFEGATPEIKQSITDYMNGWRYEEGIIHEHGETFEHYLRRVIQKIINKRKSAGKR